MSATATSLAPPDNKEEQSRPTTAETNEKTNSKRNSTDHKKRPFSFLAAKSKADEKQLASITDDASSETKNTDKDKGNGKGDKDGKEGVKETFPPVPFFDLYKFSTKFEVALMLIGLFCAVLSGAAQVSPSLIIHEIAIRFHFIRREY